MALFPTELPGEGAKSATAPTADSRFEVTPAFGTLGPGSDIAVNAGMSTPDPVQRPAKAKAAGPIFAVVAGVLFAVLVASSNARASWLTSFFRDSPSTSSPGREPVPDERQIDRMKPQKQAETLLELAVGEKEGAAELIQVRAARWQGKVKWDSQIATLTTAALNSNDMRVRESGVEVELAAYGLGKNEAGLNYVLQAADSPDHARKVWGLWALGLMANRGLETERIVDVLATHLADADEDSRRWAVEGMALSGSGRTIAPLLRAMHDDPSAIVRERAACSLAESGMYSGEQRMTAIPELLRYTDDPTLDAQTHGWAFQALSEITHQRLPNDSLAWRSWYQSTKSE